MEYTKSRDGELIRSGVKAGSIKETIDLAHCRGYAVLIQRVTSADEPDEQAVYNIYQIDANKGKAVGDMYEALSWVSKMASHSPSDSQVILMAIKALAKAEGQK